MADLSGIPPAILEKIRKLMALAEDSGATENESSTAFMMARRLMMQHHIEDFSSIKGSNARISVYEIVEQSYTIMTGPSGWRDTILSACINKLNCRHFYYSKAGPSCTVNGESEKVLNLIGAKEDIALATAMYEWLCEQVARLAGRGWMEDEIKYMMENGKERKANKRSRDKWLEDFKAGCATRIYWRITQEQKEDSAEIMAMVVSRDVELTDYMKKFKLTNGAVTRYQHGEGYDKGYEAGARISLGTKPGQVGGAKGLIGDGQ